MTPQNALALALIERRYASTPDYAAAEADAILAALPEGWALIESDPYGTLADFRRRVEREERERLLRLCGRDRDCECPIHHDLRLRE